MGTILTITAKGQVTLRKEVLRHLGIGPGDKVAVDMQPDGGVSLHAVPEASYAGKGFEKFSGCLARPGIKPLSIEEINEIAAAGWAGEIAIGGGHESPASHRGTRRHKSGGTGG